MNVLDLYSGKAKIWQSNVMTQRGRGGGGGGGLCKSLGGCVAVGTLEP